MLYQFIKIQFETTGRIIGATIEKYLLEKTRVVHQSDTERNFHVRSWWNCLYLTACTCASTYLANVKVSLLSSQTDFLPDATRRRGGTKPGR